MPSKPVTWSESDLKELFHNNANLTEASLLTPGTFFSPALTFSSSSLLQFWLITGKRADYCVISVFSLFHSAHGVLCGKTENSTSPAQELIALDSYLHWKM